MEKINVEVSEIMSTNLKVLHPKDRLIRAKEMFKEFDIHHIPVAVVGRIKGVLSLGDLLFLEGVARDSFDEYLKTKKYQFGTVDEVMTPRPYCVDANDKISKVVDIMIDKRINCLPVLDGEELVGLITNFDIIKYFRKALNTNSNGS